MSLTDEPHIIIYATLVKSTERAVWLELSDGERFWVPKSCSEYLLGDRWAIARWWADKNGVEP